MNGWRAWAKSSVRRFYGRPEFALPETLGTPITAPPGLVGNSP
jgi:hypothetical protein